MDGVCHGSSIPQEGYTVSAKDVQVAGSHYKDMAIQPIEYITKNNLGYIQGNIIKYATRYPHKGQAVDDLRKIKHYCDLAIEELQGNTQPADPPVQTYKVELSPYPRPKLEMWP